MSFNREREGEVSMYTRRRDWDLSELGGGDDPEAFSLCGVL